MLIQPVIHDVPIQCIKQAAITYHVAPELIVAILDAEGGTVGMAKRNSNGTYDYGPMQINSIWLEKIAAYGYTKALVQYNPCVNVAVGAWILSNNLTGYHDFWQGAAGYHSYTNNLNELYQIKIRNNYEMLTRN